MNGVPLVFIRFLSRNPTGQETVESNIQTNKIEKLSAKKNVFSQGILYIWRKDKNCSRVQEFITGRPYWRALFYLLQRIRGYRTMSKITNSQAEAEY